MAHQTSTSRFSDRVEHYIRYRPGYPAEMFDWLRGECGLRSEHVVADVGSGTGLLTEPLLKSGAKVFGIEPNAEMRAAGERLLRGYNTFRSIEGTAERTTLPDACVDWITVGQAFHWFDVERCREEFRRILRSGGRVLLVWNERREDTPFLSAYEAFVRRFASDYAEVKHQNVRFDGRIRALFEGAFVERTFANQQNFDFDGLRGRVLSSSYMPGMNDAACEPMLAALRNLFDRFESNGRVAFEYETAAFLGNVRSVRGE